MSMYAANNGHPDTASALIKAGADAEARDPRGMTPLIIAVAASRYDVVTVLLDAGAHVNAQASGNVTALHVAAGVGDIHMVRTLVLAGADVSLTTTDGSDAESIVLSGPQPASAERHAVAGLLSGLSGAPRQHQRAVEASEADDADEEQEL